MLLGVEAGKDWRSASLGACFGAGFLWCLGRFVDDDRSDGRAGYDGNDDINNS